MPFHLRLGRVRQDVSIEPSTMSGQRVTSNPHQTLNLLNARKEQLQEELRTVEKQVRNYFVDGCIVAVFL